MTATPPWHRTGPDAEPWAEAVIPAATTTEQGQVLCVIDDLLNEPALNRELPVVAVFKDVDERGRPAVVVQMPLASWTGPAAGLRTAIGARTGPADPHLAQPARVPLSGPVFGGSGLPQATRQFLSRARPVIASLARLPRSGDQALLNVVLQMMTAHLVAVGPSTLRGRAGPDPGAQVPLSFLSFRSHAEAFLSTTPDRHPARRAFAQEYDRGSAAIEETVRRVLEHFTGGPGPVQPVPDLATRWHDLVRAAKAEYVDGFNAGELLIRREGQRPLNGPNGFENSDFHTVVQASEGLLQVLGTDSSLLATRLLTSLLYLAIFTAGVSLTERYLLCYLISRACEAVYSVGATDLLREIVSRY